MKLNARLAVLAGLIPPSDMEAGNAVASSADTETEKELHRAIEAMLRRNGIRHYCHARMDRRSTVAVGWPDFTVPIPGGRVIFWEVKNGRGKPTERQIECIAALRANGHEAIIVRSAAEAEKHLMEHLAKRTKG